MLFIPDRHEALNGAPWSDAAARDGISALVADACSQFDPATLWPTHPRDGEPGEPALPIASMYHGAAGAIWSLQHLQRAGLAEMAIDFGPCIAGLLEPNRRFNDAARSARPSYRWATPAS